MVLVVVIAVGSVIVVVGSTSADCYYRRPSTCYLLRAYAYQARTARQLEGSYLCLLSTCYLLPAYQARTARQLEGAALLALARYEEARLSSRSKKT